jgi:hypothetical protein
MSDPSEGDTAEPRRARPQPPGSLRAWATIPRWGWLAIAAAAIVVVAVIAVVAGLWATIGAGQISLVGWIALVFGIIVALGLWIGLMSLMFISNRRGYDDV